MYIGASTLAAPIARPPTIRQVIKACAEAAAPVANALTRKSAALNSMVGRRPIMLAKAPAPNAPPAHPSRTEATANPVAAVWVPNDVVEPCRESIRQARRNLGRKVDYAI